MQTGLRVSELTGLTCGDIHLGTAAHLAAPAKDANNGHPADQPTAKPLAGLAGPSTGERPGDPLFPTRTGRRLSDDAVERRIAIHTQHAAQRCPSLASKNVTPHTLRHTAAMALLHAGVDTAVIALWLGHADIRSTQIYLHADMTIKERALARTTPPTRRQADTTHPTPSSPSSTACDYPEPTQPPDRPSPRKTASARDNQDLRIIRTGRPPATRPTSTGP